MDLASIIKIAPEAIRAYISRKGQKQKLARDFVLDAIGLQECLSPDSHESGTVSLATIDLRVQMLQRAEPQRASNCGIPAIGDARREEKLKEILREIVSAGKLQRCRQADRWKVS